MKRSPFVTDAFARNPLVALLPVVGAVRNLAGLTSSLYARYERVSLAKRQLHRDNRGEQYRQYLAEEAMLREVLEWLAAAPQHGEDGEPDLGDSAAALPQIVGGEEE